MKNGKTAYYRSGKRVESYYQRRLAKGVLEGKTVAEARGHPFGKYEQKRLTRSDIEAQEEFHLGAWAEPPTRSGRGQARSAYYVKVSVTSESIQQAGRPGSPTGDGEACVVVTLPLSNPDRNEQDGFTYSELTRNFERIVAFTLDKYGLALCNGNLAQDLVHVWRHSRR